MFLGVPFLCRFDRTCLVLNLIKEQNRINGVMARMRAMCQLKYICTKKCTIKLVFAASSLELNLITWNPFCLLTDHD